MELMKRGTNSAPVGNESKLGLLADWKTLREIIKIYIIHFGRVFGPCEE